MKFWRKYRSLQCIFGINESRGGGISSGRTKQSGFTLIEVMVVVAIAAILASIAIPNLRNMLQRTRTRSAARQLRVDLQKAKLEAVKRNADCLVEFTVASGQESGSCVTCISTDNDCGDSGDLIVSQLNFNDYPNTVLESANFSGSPLFVFNSRGIPQQTGGGMAAGNSVINCTSDALYSLSLILASSGRIRIE